MAQRGADRGKESRGAALARRFSPLLKCAAIGGSAALAFLLVWGSLEARARVRSDPRFDLSRFELELGPLPPWAPAELRDELKGVTLARAGEEPLTAFTPRVLDVVRRRLLECSWVREVRGLKLRYGSPGAERAPYAAAGALLDPPPFPALAEGPPAGSRVELEIDLRRPMALVAADGGLFLTDREAVRIGPPVSPKRVKQLGLPAITGGEERVPRRPPAPGVAWEDRAVREGLEVARVLFDAGIREEFPGTPIDAIDITNVGERARPSECEVVLRAGPLRLGWGRSPISPGARTLTVAEILANVRRVLRSPNLPPPGGTVLLYTSPVVVAPRQIQ